MKNMQKIAGILGAILCSATVLFSEVHAYTVSPLVVEMDGTPGARTTIRIENTKSTPITLEVVVKKRTISKDGSEVLTPAPDDFIILPPQTIVQPGKVQNLRVQYLGDVIQGGSAHYRVTVMQVPVTFDSQDDSIRAQMVLSFGVAVHLSPPKTKEIFPEVTVITNGQELEISLENLSEHHFLTGNKTYTLVNGQGERHELKYSAMANRIGVNVIPGSATRLFKIPVPEGLDTSGQLTLEIQQNVGGGN